MSNGTPRLTRWIAHGCAGFAAGVLAVLTSAQASDSQSLVNVDLSGNQSRLAAGVPVVAVDPSKAGHLAVAWRFIDPLGGSNAATSGNWVCHVSVSRDNGRTFTDRTLDWHIPSLTRCNAPWVGFSRRGALYVAATLTGAPPGHTVSGAAQAPGPTAVPEHPNGTVGFMTSADEGRTWSAAVSAIPSHAADRFATDDSIPAAAKQVPWDGARGAVDLETDTIYLSGAFPARPGGAQHSQRFYTVSVDGGKTFGAIRAFGSAAWPERWDGDIAAAAHEFIASYIADSTPDGAKPCPCAVIALSHDQGLTLSHSLVATAGELDLDTLVHYPEVAADPAHRHRFALALIGAGKTGVTVLVTADDGTTWRRLEPGQPSDVISVTRPAVAFSPRGVLVAAWRGVHADGSYDIYAAAAGAGTGRIGRVAKISTRSSTTPPAWRETYAVRGDFHTSVAVDDIAAHVSWADARDAADIRALYARVPLRALLQ